MTLSRRRLLQAAAGTALSAALSGPGSWGAAARALALPLRRPGSLPYPNLPVGTDTLPQIEHVLVLMMENHSYDNYLGMLGRAPGQQPRGDGFTIGADGGPTATNPYADGSLQHAFHMPTTCQLPAKPSQEWQASHQQFNGGRNDGFVVSPSGPVAMGYWTGEDLPFAYSLAQTFPLADRWFSSVLGQTYPNRRYLIAATSAGMVDDVLAEVTVPAPNGTIFDRLDAFGISWKNYYSTLPTADVYLLDAQANATHLVNIQQFFTDAATGNLPGFAIIDPNFTTQSEENPQDILVGEAFAAQVVKAVLNSPAWPRTLLVWTYDEHGGYFDHVPPIAPPGESSYDGFSRYGFRVPAVVVSPYARRGLVTHVVHDHTSVAAMLERKWNLPAMTYRDANAADLLDFLDLNAPGFPEPPVLTAALSFPATCEKTGPGTIPPRGSVSSPSSAIGSPPAATAKTTVAPSPTGPSNTPGASPAPPASTAGAQALATTGLDPDVAALGLATVAAGLGAVALSRRGRPAPDSDTDGQERG